MNKSKIKEIIGCILFGLMLLAFPLYNVIRTWNQPLPTLREMYEMTIQYDMEHGTNYSQEYIDKYGIRAIYPDVEE